MIVKTKKYALEPKVFRKLAMGEVLKDFWWAFLVPITMVAMKFVLNGGHWWWIVALVLTILYLAFWWIQFSAAAQLPQFQTLFQKMSYDINSQHVMMKLDAKRGMPIGWDKIKKAKMTKKAFVMVITRAQFIYLPMRIFNNTNDIKFVESVLKRKKLIK